MEEPKKYKVIKLKKKYALILILALVAIFGIVVGTSYAFFSHSVTGEDYIVYTGTLEVEYEKKTDTVNLQDTKPMTNEEGLALDPYSFDIKNQGSIEAKYQVRLEPDNNNTLPLEYVKVSVYKNDTEYLKPTKLSDINSNLVIVKNGLLDASGKDNYKVRFWVDINAGNDTVGKEFKARVIINAMQNVADGYDVNTAPIITLNKDSNNNTHINLIKGDTFTDPGVESVKDDTDVLKISDVTTTYEYYDGTNLTTVDSVDTNTIGIYYITYSIADNDNLEGKSVRVVTVNNTETVPTITLNGESTMVIAAESTFTDPGVTVGNNIQVATIGEVKTSTPGTYIIRYIAIDSENNMNSVTRTVTVNIKTVWDFDYTGDVQTFTAPYAGTYKLETWGAQGGSGYDSDRAAAVYGGKGGYSSGLVNLSKTDNLYIFVGEEGPTAMYNTTGPETTYSAYPNGGIMHTWSSTSDSITINGGGGSTHIATENKTIEELSGNINKLLIVAGGGGGACNYWQVVADGGYGGGTTGGGTTANYINVNATGGTQTAGGSYGGNSNTNINGKFGVGGGCTTQSCSGTGGGGYYGGGASWGGSGAGGSGYIGGVTNGTTIAGNASMPTHDGTSTMTGNSGNGYARITYLGNN